MARKNRGPWIITHFNPDLDAILSVIIALLFAGKFKDARILLKPSFWNGKGITGAKMILDIDADGAGYKGLTSNDGKTLSAFGQLVGILCSPENMVALGYPANTRKLLEPLARYLDREDSTPSAIHDLLRSEKVDEKEVKYFERFSIKTIFNIVNHHFNGDVHELVEFMTFFLKGYIALRDQQVNGVPKTDLVPLAVYTPAWAGYRFGDPETKGARITNSSNLRGRVIGLDQFKGGTIIDDEGNEHEAFRYNVQKYVKKRRYKNILKKMSGVMRASIFGIPLSQYLIENAPQEILDELDASSLETMFYSIQLAHRKQLAAGDYVQITKMMNIVLGGYITDAQLYFDAQDLVEKALSDDPSDNESVKDQIKMIGKDIAFIQNVKNYKVANVLFGSDVKYIVRVDGTGIIVQANNTTYGLDTHLEELYDVIRAAGEILAPFGFKLKEGWWFRHPAFHTFARGTSTAPVSFKSKVDPWDLCLALERAWARIKPIFFASPEGQALLEKRRLEAEAKAQEDKRKAEREAEKAKRDAEREADRQERLAVEETAQLAAEAVVKTEVAPKAARTKRVIPKAIDFSED